MSAKPRLLFLSPVMPAADGNGLAMRAGLFLEAYARRFTVTLVVLPVAQAGATVEPSVLALRHAERVEILPLAAVDHPHFVLIARLADPAERRAAWRRYPRPRVCRYAPAAAAALLRARLGPRSFALAHVERLYMAPLADAYLEQRPRILDLDEDDAAGLAAIAALRRLNGEAAAEVDEDEAVKFALLQGEYLARFDLVLMAAENELAALAARHPQARLAHLANAVRRPAPSAVAAGLQPEPIDLLMVGTLGYYPNADAAEFLCRAIRPHLLGPGRRVPRIRVVGRAPAPELLALGEIPGVTIEADPVDLARHYAAATVAVAPLRAGAGSRIKILEAFAHAVPVVATRMAAAGLAVEDGRNLLLADEPADFASAVRRLWDDPGLAGQIAGEGRRLVEREYSFEKIAARIETLAEATADVIDCRQS
jgi:polysaccharide biosynthesis protein PslH